MTARHRWRFDLDGTLVDGLTATQLRPYAAELLSALRARGCEVTVWSAGGVAYAARVLSRVDLASAVDAVLGKERGHDGRWRVGVDVGELVCVDDQPDGLPLGVDVRAVSPYLGPNPHDRALLGLWEGLLEDP